LTALGLGVGNFLGLQRLVAESKAQLSPRAKSCILIWLDGGPSHLESFDPKPDAPKEVRGPMTSIPTNLNGVRLGECLENTAAIMDKVAIVRSMTSPLGEHQFGTHYMMTGYKPSPALVYPTMGATLAHLRSQIGVLPSNIAVPAFPNLVSGSGYLSGSVSPFSVGGDPRSRDFKVRDLDLYAGIDLARLDRRLEFVEAIDAFESGKNDSNSTPTDPDLVRAYNLLANPEAKRAFSLSDEPEALRQSYGGLDSGSNNIGQSCLLARRLVERGVPFVTVNSNGWDAHQDIIQLKARYPTDKNGLLPSLDRAFATLVRDLSDRGMLNETLVVVMGEFGRTPRINSNAGRDHWPNCFSVALAGGGIQGGQVVGSSDSLGEFPKERPVTPSDLAATIYTLLGIDPATELQTPDGRPVRVTPDGSKVVSELV
jgi:hypothetical protein